MTWLNPVALLGLVALGVPVLIHLFGRRVARTQKFPSLRLIGESSPTPATRSLPSDIPLLIVRCAIVLAAVLALAQPLFPTARRVRAAERPVRLILLDTSASVTAVDAARARGVALLDSSNSGMIVEAVNPGLNLAGAASWLARFSGRRELVVISDFQSGTLHEAQVALVPGDIGLRFERVTPAGPVAAAPVMRAAGTDSVMADSSGTVASWRVVRVDTVSLPALLASADELVRLQDDTASIRSLHGRGLRSVNRVALVFPAYPSRRALAEQSLPLDSAWQGSLLVSLLRDRGLAELTGSASVARDCELPGTVFVHNARGTPVASLARGPRGTAHDLLLFSCVEAGTLASVALLGSVALSLEPALPLNELEPRTLPDDLLRRWQREPTPSTPGGSNDTSPDGRWLWLVALGLLGVEEWLRRRSPRRTTPVDREAETHARVA